MADIVLFGDSFVRCFEEYLHADRDRFNLGLSEDSFKIRCYGFGGLSLSRKNQLHSVDSSIAAADLIFISLGSNDLCDANYPPHKFARDIVSYANYLKCGLEIK